MVNASNVPLFARIPVWISVPVSVGGALIFAALGTFPDWAQVGARNIGIALVLFGLVALVCRGFYGLAKRVGLPQAIVVGSAIGAALLIVMALLAGAFAVWKAGGIAPAIGAVPAEKGPLIWFSNLTLEPPVGSGVVYSLRFNAKNISGKELKLKSARLISKDGDELPLEIVAYSRKEGTNVIVPIDKINLIPPGAQLELVAKFNLPDGIKYDDFLDKWPRFVLNAEDESEQYRIPFGEVDLMAFFPGKIGPRVTVKE